MLATNTFRDEMSLLPAKRGGGRNSKFWRMEDPILKFEGDACRVLRGGMFAHQRNWWNLNNFIKILVTGYGGGKTMTLCKRMISLALLNAPAPCAIVSPSYPQAKLTVIPTITELLAGKQALLGRSNFTYKYNATPPIYFELRRGVRRARLYILSADKPEAMKGGNLAAVGMDEPFIQPYESFKQILARVRHPQSKRSEIAIAGTPENLNWGYELCEGELRSKHDVGVVHASTHDNRAMGTYARRLEAGYDSETVRAYVGGQFVNMTQGRVYYTFEHLDHMISRSVPANAEWGCGMDFNVNPMAFIVFWHTPDGHMHFVKEYELPNSDTDFACKVLLEDFPDLHKVYPDASGGQRKTAASGQSDFTILRRHGFQICANPSNPAIRDRQNSVNGKFRPHTGRVSLTISEECKNLRKYLEQYSHELKNKQERMSHLLDAFSYPVAYLHPINAADITRTQVLL